MNLEQLRKGLIRWNVAPLALVAVMVITMVWLIRFYMDHSCELPEWHVAGIFGLITAIAGIIYKMYNSMQKDRGDH